MGPTSNRDRLVPYIGEIVSKKARSLKRNFWFTYDDLDDLIQHLTLAVLLKVNQFDPRRGNEKQFISTIVNREIANLIERQKTKKRGAGFSFVSLDEEIDPKNGGTKTRQEVGIKEIYYQSKMAARTPDEDRLDARIDLRLIQKNLPPDMCELLTTLLSNSPLEAARELGIPRTTLNDRRSKLFAHLRKSKKWG